LRYPSHCPVSNNLREFARVPGLLSENWIDAAG
jgi:hypothetical protein